MNVVEPFRIEVLSDPVRGTGLTASFPTVTLVTTGDLSEVLCYVLLNTSSARRGDGVRSVAGGLITCGWAYLKHNSPTARAM